MFLIIAVGGVGLGLFTIVALLVASTAMRHEDRMLSGVRHGPQTATRALTRRLTGLHVRG